MHTILAAICCLLVTVGAQTCGNRLSSCAECKTNVILGRDYDTLMQKNGPIIQRCAQMNTTFQPCAQKVQAMLTCKKQMAQLMNTDPQIAVLKRQAVTDIDQCFQTGRYPKNPFFVTMMMDGPPHGKKGPHGPPGMMGPPPPGSMPPPPGMFGPQMIGQPNSMDAQNRPWMPRGNMQPPPPLMPNNDFANMGNGDNTQEKPRENVRDFTKCLETLIKGVFQQYSNGQNSQIQDAPWGMGPNSNMNRGVGNSQPREMGGPKERGGKGDKMKMCRPFFECVMTGEAQLSTDQDVMATARRIFDSHQKCETDNKPTFDCTPSSMELDKCIMTAKRQLMQMKEQKMKECMTQQGVDVTMWGKEKGKGMKSSEESQENEKD